MGSADVSAGDTVLASQQADLRDDIIDQITTKGDLALGTGADAMIRLGIGANDEVLTADSGEASGAKWAALGGNLVLIGTAEASNSASLTITGLDSTYDTYLITISDLVPANDNESVRLRFGDSGGIDSGATDYEYHCSKQTTNVATWINSAQSTGDTQIRLTAGGVGSDTGEGFGGVIWLSRPGDGVMYPSISGTFSALDNAAVLTGGFVIGRRKAVITLTQIQILFSAGNIESGRVTVFGVKHA